MTRKKVKRKAPISASKRNSLRKLDTLFSCPLCNHEKSIDCKLYHTHLYTRDRQRGLGFLLCKVCHAEYKNLSHPIDVYSDWMDDFTTLNKKQAPSPEPPGPISPTEDPSHNNDDDDQDGFFNTDL